MTMMLPRLELIYHPAHLDGPWARHWMLYRWWKRFLPTRWHYWPATLGVKLTVEYEGRPRQYGTFVTLPLFHTTRDVVKLSSTMAELMLFMKMELLDEYELKEGVTPHAWNPESPGH